MGLRIVINGNNLFKPVFMDTEKQSFFREPC